MTATGKRAVITGAGTGVGRAVAVALGREGWRLALVGRRRGVLEEAADEARLAGAAECMVFAMDVSDVAAVKAMAREVLGGFGGIEALVNSAGTNIQRRSLEELAEADYRHLIEVNLNGAYYCIQAFLGAMREARCGTIVNIVSDSAKQVHVKAGAAYVASKFGLAGLTQAVNAEERAHGIRACAIYPGEINTPLLDKRPVPPPVEARVSMLQGEDIAACVKLVIALPARATVEEILIRPT